MDDRKERWTDDCAREVAECTREGECNESESGVAVADREDAEACTMDWLDRRDMASGFLCTEPWVRVE